MQIKLFFFVIITLCPTIMMGQDDDSFWKRIKKVNPFRSYTPMEYEGKIAASVHSLAVRIDQRYVIAKKKKKYGRGDLSYFGRSTGIGVYTNKGLIVSGHVATPWARDSEFDKRADEYTPELSEAIFTSNQDSLVNIEVDAKVKVEVEGNLAYYHKKHDAEINIIEASNGEGMLLVYEIPESDSTVISPRIIPMEANWHDGQCGIDEQISSQDILGGFFIIEEISTAKIDYKIMGVLSKEPSGNWILAAINKSDKEGGRSKSKENSGELNELDRKNRSKNHK